ncbi:DUF4397 domain-containing protein [Amnibacterium setariae]|uniref:DUF4397 domain-containing protein n=1 Tax=Amnibacterium setariae TaxID=2306585 RepID=A0A3A1TU20_9MICO|nr:DUF4397 domain-containing protein [Amnibacterium setariae]RIX26561.1 DUF4397 domain-containing protein [Amnibacterium setariae]
MRRALTAGAALGLVAALGLAVPAEAKPAHYGKAPATVGVFHGIPKTPVDVYVGSKRVLDDFQPGTFSPSLSLKQGTYLVRVTAATAKNAKHPILKAHVSLKSAKSYSLIAHLTEKGRPTLTKYTNDLRAVGAGQARLTVRHVAAAPPVRVVVNGFVAVPFLKNPHQAKGVLYAGTYDVKVQLAASPNTTVLSAKLPVAAGTNAIVYAWGSAKDGTLALATRAPALKH